MSKTKHLKKPLMGAAFLATASTAKAGTGGGVTEGGKSQLGVNYLSLEEVPSENIKICVPEGMSKTAEDGNFHFMPDSLSVVIPPFETSTVKMTFVVSQMVSYEEDHVLILAYSQQKSPSPPIDTPRSLRKFELDLNTLEIVGLYNVPALNLEPQGQTRIGQANPSPRSKVEFDINFDTTSIPALMDAGVNEIYVQATLLRKSDYASGRFDNMILSEVDTIHFEKNDCPDDHIVFGEARESGKSLIGNRPPSYGRGKSGGGGVTEGGREVLGVNALHLEEALGQNAKICRPENVTSVGGFQFIPDNSMLVVDPFQSFFIEMNFWVSDVLPDDKDRVLVLGYSPKLSPSPQIPTPLSLNKFQLDLKSFEVLAIYNIPAQSLLAQDSTHIGTAVSKQTSKQVIKVNLDTSTLLQSMRKNEAVYVQAWLQPRSDVEETTKSGNRRNFYRTPRKGSYSMILSEVDTIRLVLEECPTE
jgi:hypothetical protein